MATQRAAPRRHAAASAAPEPFVEARLVDDEGRDVGAGDAGRAAGALDAGRDPRRHFFSGYLKDERATEEAWAGGWFHTGDMVRRDADGSFTSSTARRT